MAGPREHPGAGRVYARSDRLSRLPESVAGPTWASLHGVAGSPRPSMSSVRALVDSGDRKDGADGPSPVPGREGNAADPENGRLRQ